MCTKHQKLFSVLLLISASIIVSTYAIAGGNGEPAPVGRPSGQTHPTLYPGGVWEPGPARYGSTIVDDVAVTMDDGVVLRANVAYPTDPCSGLMGSKKL